MSSLDDKDTPASKSGIHSLHSSMNDDMLLEPTDMMVFSSSSLQLSSVSLLNDGVFRSSLESKKPKRHSSDESMAVEDEEMQGDNHNAQATTALHPTNDANGVFRSSLEAKKPKRQPSWNDNSNNLSSSSNMSVEKSFLEISHELSHEFPPSPQELTGRTLSVRKAFRISMPSVCISGDLEQTMGVTSILDSMMSDNDDDNGDKEESHESNARHN